MRRVASDARARVGGASRHPACSSTRDVLRSTMPASFGVRAEADARSSHESASSYAHRLTPHPPRAARSGTPAPDPPPVGVTGDLRHLEVRARGDDSPHRGARRPTGHRRRHAVVARRGRLGRAAYRARRWGRDARAPGAGGARHLLRRPPRTVDGAGRRGLHRRADGSASGGPVEARVRRAAGDAWRPGARGEASVVSGRSNVLGALWWNARQLVRTDLLL